MKCSVHCSTCPYASSSFFEAVCHASMEGKEIMVPSGGASAGQAARRFRVGGVPPLAEGFTDRPDTAPGIMEALAPGLAVVLVPGSAFAETPQNWLGACGKTHLAVS